MPWRRELSETMEFIPQIAIFATVGLSIYGFSRFQDRVRGGTLSRGKGLALYLMVALSPALLYVAIALLLVGAEELTGNPLVPELFARGFMLTLALCLVIALLGFILLAARMAFIKVSPRSS